MTTSICPQITALDARIAELDSIIDGAAGREMPIGDYLALAGIKGRLEQQRDALAEELALFDATAMPAPMLCDDLLETPVRYGFPLPGGGMMVIM